MCFSRFCSVAKLCLTLQPHGLQHARLLCPPLYPRVCLNSCPLSWWCHPTISSSVTPFSSWPQISWHQGLCQWVGFASAGQSIDVSTLALVLPIQCWFTLGFDWFDLLVVQGTLKSIQQKLHNVSLLIRLHLLGYRECLTDFCTMKLPPPSRGRCFTLSTARI